MKRITGFNELKTDKWILWKAKEGEISIGVGQVIRRNKEEEKIYLKAYALIDGKLHRTRFQEMYVGTDMPFKQIKAKLYALNKKQIDRYKKEIIMLEFENQNGHDILFG